MKTFGNRSFFERSVTFQAVNQIADPAFRGDTDKINGPGRLGRAESNTHCLAGRDLARTLLPEIERVLNLLRAHLHPLPPKLHQRSFHRRQRAQFAQRDLFAAYRDLPLELQQFVERESTSLVERTLHVCAKTHSR